LLALALPLRNTGDGRTGTFFAGGSDAESISRASFRFAPVSSPAKFQSGRLPPMSAVPSDVAKVATWIL